MLLSEGATICAYDPEGVANTRSIIGDKIVYGENAYRSLENSDALIIVTEWNEFRTPDFNKMRKLLKEPVIFDGRNLYDVDKMANLNFTYYSIGRSVVKK
jgi:UDPglucose 6-dehydrogenase